MRGVETKGERADRAPVQGLQGSFGGFAGVAQEKLPATTREEWGTLDLSGVESTLWLLFLGRYRPPDGRGGVQSFFFDVARCSCCSLLLQVTMHAINFRRLLFHGGLLGVGCDMPAASCR